jgi:PhzF family phenazine biosynthesis protein
MNDRLLVTIVDACLRDGRGGSPTAVLWDVSQSDAERRRVPELTGASHAVFVRADDGVGGGGHAEISLRFFTSTGELPACGHGTVAALAFLAGETGRADFAVTLRAAGRVFAGCATPDEHGAFAEFDPGEVQIRDARVEDYDGVLAALGRDSESFAAELCLASVGRARLLVPIGDPCALAEVSPDYDRLRDACDHLGLLGCYVHSLPSAGGRLAARMFAPSIGVPEDIANANSTACLAARLAQRGVHQISVDMGDSMNRPATIAATARETASGVQIRVGGAAKITETAWLKMPRAR